MEQASRTKGTSEGHRTHGGFAVLRFNPAARRAVLTVALSHAVMVGLMSMTPVHMISHGVTLTLVGFTISLHVAGMYGLPPLFGLLTDRLGGRTVVLAGQGMFVAALLLSIFRASDQHVIMVALVLLGLGWSAATIAGATLLSSALSARQRPAVQGTSDLLMNLAGAVGDALAGPVLGWAGFSGLATALLVLVAVVIASQLFPRR